MGAGSHHPEAGPLPPVFEPVDELRAVYDLPGVAPALLVLALSIATVGVIAMTGGSEPPESVPASRKVDSGMLAPTETPSLARASPSVSDSPVPTADTAGAAGIALTFDMLPTGVTVSDWALTGEGTFEVTAAPTAVNRSARLVGTPRAMACMPLDIVLGTLAATFMVDGATDDEQPLLSFNFDDGTVLAIRSTANGIVAADSTDAISLEPGAWYRLSVSANSDHAGIMLRNAAGDLLTETRSRVDNARAIDFCITSVAPMRVYLDELIVEAR